MSDAAADETGRKSRLYRMIWRWHFYAGLFCIPFVIVLAVTGSVYLFRPQIESYIDRDLTDLPRFGPAHGADMIANAAIASTPGSKLAAYILPEQANQAVQVVVSEHGAQTRVYVRPDTLAILKSVDEEGRFRRIVFKMHGELLMGSFGSVLVELAASWAIVIVLSGLYLWWPRHARGLAGVLYPRLNGRYFWRDLHAVTGIYVSVFALFLLITGLPWALVWGQAFKGVRQITGTAAIAQDWTTSTAGEHAEHREQEHDQLAARPTDVSLEMIVARASEMRLAPPVLVSPPTSRTPYWKISSDAANRPLRATIWLSPQTGELVAREDFTGRHIIDRIVGYGVAAHEGQLFGWANQLLGLLTAVGLMTLCISAFVMWRKRAPAGVLGAPPPIPDTRIGAALAAIIVVAGLFLPVLGASLIVIALLERIILSRWPACRAWLGLEGPTQ